MAADEKGKREIVLSPHKYEVDVSESRIFDYSETFRKVLAPHEDKVLLIQRLLVWETPFHSFLMVVIVNISLWIVTNMRFYGLIGTLGFCYFCSSLWSYHIWPEIRVPLPVGASDSEEWTTVHPRVLGVPELSRHLAVMSVRFDNWCEWAYNLKRKEPGKFFIYSMMLFALLAFVGHYIRGTYLLYALVLALFTVPGLYYHNMLEQFDHIFNPIVTNIESSMYIKRKRSKKGRKSPECGASDAGEKQMDTSDEEIQEFIPENVSLLSLKMKSTGSDDETTGLTPNLLSNQRMPEVTPSHDISDSDSTYSDLPSQMPSIMLMDDSQSTGFTPQHDNFAHDYASDSTDATEITDMVDTAGDTNYNNNQAAWLYGSGIPVMEAWASDDDSTLHDQPSITSMTSSLATTTPRRRQLADKSESRGEERLEFKNQHFKEESSDEDEDYQLTRGLVFPDVQQHDPVGTTSVGAATADSDQRLGAGALGLLSTLSQAATGGGAQRGVGDVLAGALSSAHDTVSSTIASQMMANLVNTTVAGISKQLGVRDPTSRERRGRDLDPLPSTTDSDIDFEILDVKDFEPE